MTYYLLFLLAVTSVLTSPIQNEEANGPKDNAPKTIAPKANAPKDNAPKANAPKTLEYRQPHQPKANGPIANAPKAIAPKANAPKSIAPKANAPKTLEYRKPDQPSIIAVLEASVALLQKVVEFMSGRASINDIVFGLQNMFEVLGKLINLKGFVENLPVVGGSLAPVVDAASKVVANTPMMGGMLSSLVGGE